MSTPGADAAAEQKDLDPAAVLEVLTAGELTITGRITNASNATLYGSVALNGVTLNCVHKPVAGERPLWDFPNGTLAAREVAAYELSQATGWRIVPPTVMREGPWGPGMCQLWIDTPDEDDHDLLALLPEDFDEDPAETAETAGSQWRPVLSVELSDGRPAVLAHKADERLRRIAAFDAVVNNADRKGGHLLVGTAEPDHVYGIDHGLTFNVDDKLRTLLWGFSGEPLGAEVREVLAKLDRDLGSGELGGRLAGLLDAEEVAATRERIRELLDSDTIPGPEGRRRPVPWPPF
ncbi:SCO1664 family protein [Catenulispora pinisilvae]|uniref:SCO1664 family protein n=1 Tax=Catenulispora pinisilvae TaxID=2705253 RepID=UPI001E4D7B89|nr:SCO1664 family protein [Catenulispora pinisilvae]